MALLYLILDQVLLPLLLERKGGHVVEGRVVLLHLHLDPVLHLERRGGHVVEGRVGLPRLLLDPVLLDLRHPRLRLGGPHARLPVTNAALLDGLNAKRPVTLDGLNVLPRRRQRQRPAKNAALHVPPRRRQRHRPRKPRPPLHLVSVTRSEVSMTGRTRSGASTLTSASATAVAR